MTINTNVKPDAYYGMTQDDVNKITKYIDDKMTATWFTDHSNGKTKVNKGRSKGQVVTSELIYSWMIAYEVPFECQKLLFMFLKIRMLRLRK